jgi:hypothetical protein
VSAVSPTEAWAVGGEGTFFGPGYRPLILHWDGNTWSRVMSWNPSQDGDFLFDVSAPSAVDAWAVGCDEIEGEHETLILHWDGTGWSRILGPNPGLGSNELHGVSAVSPTDAWAVGDSLDLTTPVHETLILHWNGTRWSHVKSPNPSSAVNTLTGVSAVSPHRRMGGGSVLGSSWHRSRAGPSLGRHEVVASQDPEPAPESIVRSTA